MEQKIIHITAGRGPSECAFVVPKVTKELIKAAEGNNLTTTVLNKEKGEEKNTFSAVTLLIKGNTVAQFLTTWIGTILWIGQSPYRKFHRRKNWYVGVFELPSDSISDQAVSDSTLKYETFRAGGPGGQHVNKVETAVRVTHLSTGLSAVARDSKSQLQNKKEAKRKLLDLLAAEKINELVQRQKTGWENHQQVARGNPIRVFKGTDFKPNHYPKKYRDERKKKNDNW